MSDSGVLSVSKEDLQLSQTITSVVDNDYDFVQLFPPELSNKLFTYVSDKDLFSCAKCSISWQIIINNNVQWRARCIKRGWTSNDSDNPYKWNLVESHVSQNDIFKFRPSPAFNLPTVASLRIFPICDWAVYYRQCMHLKRNWSKGIYVIHRLSVPDQDIVDPMVINTTDCNGSLLAIGTCWGHVLLWSIEGVPKYIKRIKSVRNRVEVEAIRLTSKYLLILYQIGLIRVFNSEKNSKTGDFELDLVYQIRGIGTQSPDGFEFNLNAEYIPEDSEIYQYNSEQEADLEDDSNVELWIRDLFRTDLWLGNEYFGSDMLLYANKDYVVLTGLLCKCFIIWDIHEGKVSKKVQLKPGFQVCNQGYLSSKKLYLSTKKALEDGNDVSSCYLLVYDVSILENELSTTSHQHHPLEIPSTCMVEETRADSKDERIAYSAQDGTISGILLRDKTRLFTKECNSFIDNLIVSDSLIIYHQYNGFLVGLNWDGEVCYQIEAHIGLVKGLQLFENLLVSGGDAMQLIVWNASTGEKYHTVHHQPCRIQNLFVDATKIITVGREDQPVLIGYW